jgi:hypothetical protein
MVRTVGFPPIGENHRRCQKRPCASELDQLKELFEQIIATFRLAL